MATYILYTDGGARGNPGIAGAGIVIQDEAGVVLKEDSKPLGEGTNNEAEYKGVIFGLENLEQLVGKENLSGATVKLCLDSQLIARQITKKYKTKEDRLRALCEQVWKMTDELGINLEVTEIRREQNKEADRLANEAMDLGLVSTM
jgi:ribonuclease HI